MRRVVPGATIGILGGGQLGKMLAIPARTLGYGVVVLEPSGDAPAAGVADLTLRASFEDPDAARQLAERSEVVTYEFENVSAGVVAGLVERGVVVHPSADVLRITQDRLLEHDFLHGLGIATAPGVRVTSAAEVQAQVEKWGACRLKTSRGGYDGGGQWRLVPGQRVGEVVGEKPFQVGPLLLEKEVAFEREISVIVARDQGGRVEFFPVFENRHREGILRETECPARISPELAETAREIARTVAVGVGLIGVMTVELFVVPGVGLYVNELAPRVHNSGHLTIEACNISQFEQHIRAICGLPLVAPVLKGPAAMVNLLGERELRRYRVPGLGEALGIPDTFVHLYGKGAVRVRRKMGHVTSLGETRGEALGRAWAAARVLEFVEG